MYIIMYSCSLLVLLSIKMIGAEVSVKDFVYWTKADISAWHQYFPSRLLERERLTNLQAEKTVLSLIGDIGTSLNAAVRYQAQELETAQFIMEGTSAQGCVNGISMYMDNAVAEGVSSFQDCVADVTPYLNRLYSAWTKKNASYIAAYQRVLGGIDSCVRMYPNKASWSRLKTCVESWSRNYFTVARSTMSGLDCSPAMQRFTNTVAECAQGVVGGVVDHGWRFLDMLVQCAKLSENVDSAVYEQQLTSEFYRYVTSNNVTSQIWASQKVNERKVKEIEDEMYYYYGIQKNALEKYVIESRNQSYYYGELVKYIQKYLDTVVSTSVDNPANADCVDDANSALNDILNKGSSEAMDCDIKIVDNTKFLIGQVNSIFLEINSLLPHIGNVAILQCFDEGYIFAENTISNCFSLALNRFNVNVTEINTRITDDVGVLLGYEESFFSSSALPCGKTILSKAIVEADQALYNLQRCLYISAGANYAVTTYTPLPTDFITTDEFNSSPITQTDNTTPISTIGAVYEA